MLKSHGVGLVVPLGGALVGLADGCSVSQADWDPFVVATGSVFAGSGDIEDSALHALVNGQTAMPSLLSASNLNASRFESIKSACHSSRFGLMLTYGFDPSWQLHQAGTRQEHQGKSERFGEKMACEGLKVGVVLPREGTRVRVLSVSQCAAGWWFG